MFKRILGFILAIFLVTPTAVKADEGMWLPMFVKRLNEAINQPFDRLRVMTTIIP